MNLEENIRPLCNNKSNNITEIYNNKPNFQFKFKLNKLPNLRLNDKKVYIQNTLVNNKLFQNEHMAKLNIVRNFSNCSLRVSEDPIIGKFKKNQELPKLENKNSILFKK